MSISKTSRILVASIVVIGLAGLAGMLSGPGTHGLVSDAQAIVGRPLTPVSVAGVARRTARRCAVGVYNC
jgi:hypothetical protein